MVCLYLGLSDASTVAIDSGGQSQRQAPVVFLSTETGRLYRSQDRGLHWAEVAAWAGLGVAFMLCVSPQFAQDRTVFAATADGVFRSLDGGDHWESCSFGLLDLEILCLAPAPNFDVNGLIWAGTANGGLYRSRNAGRAWRDSGLGLPDTAVQCLAVSPYYLEDQTLFAGTEGRGVYRSQDGGATWEVAGEELAGTNINCLAIVRNQAEPIIGRQRCVPPHAVGRHGSRCVLVF